MTSPAASELADTERRRLERLRLLSVVDSAPEPAFDALARIAASVCHTPIGLISLVDDTRQWFKANHGLESVSETPRDVAFCAHTILQDGVLQVPDATSDARFSANPLVTDAPGIRFYAGAPIVMPTGERIGSLCVIDRHPGQLSPEQAATLTDLAMVAQRLLLQRERLHLLTTIGDETRFQAISYASPLGIFQADARGAVFHMNGRAEDLLGVEAERAMGAGWLDAVDARDRGRVLAAWTASVAQAQPFDLEFRIMTTGDEPGHVRMQARPGTWGEPVRTGFIGVIGDITHRTNVEARLRSSSRFLERAEEISGVGGWEADLVRRSVTWTDQTCRIYELEAGHAPGFDEHLRFFGPEARARIEATAALALRTGEPWDLELPMVTARGRSIWVRSVGRAEFEDGRPVRMVGALQDVTAQKGQQDALRSANALLASVVESLPCGLSVFDAKLQLVAHNRQFRELQGFPDHLFAGDVVTFESLIRHNALRGEYGDGPPEEAVAQIVARAREPQPHHLQRTRANGVTLDIRGAPLPGGGFVTTYVDVSAARAAEAALRESEERQKRALDASHLALWDMDLVTGRLYLSENWSELMGAAAQAVVTTMAALAGRIPAEDREQMALVMVAVLKGTAESYDLEHRVRRDDGALIWIRSQGRVTQRDATGRALRASGTNQDVTVRRQAQEELARAAAVTRGTLESTADGIVVVTEKREILYHNRQFMQMWNIPTAMADSPRPELAAYVLAQLRDPHAHARQIEDIYEGTARETFDVLQLLDGRVIERYGRPLDVAGAGLGRVWSFRDVTAKARADTEIRRAKEAAEAANQAKSEFLNNVSHEIRTPLNGVLGMTRLLLDMPLGAEERRYVELAQSSGEALLGLINDLLDLGKIEAGRVEFEQIEFNLVRLVRELGDLYALRAREKGLAFALDVAHDVPETLVGDPGRLRQVLNNLLGNAIKFTPAGRVDFRIDRADASVAATMLRFTVRDTGIGIPPQAQNKLFQRFAQAESSTTREYGGTGLGLAIVRQLCEQMQGSVELESAVGRGTAFHVVLPFGLPAHPTSQTPVTVALAADQARGVFHHARILVAEDNKINQIVVLGMLDGAGYSDVTLAEDGQQAIDLAIGGGFDAILMDCRMPVLDGYAAASRLRAAGCRTPIIALTANASGAERPKCLAAGMDDFLAKPIDPELLAQVLRRWLAPRPFALFARDKALRRMGGDTVLFQRALESFVVLAPQTLIAVRDSLQRGDQPEVHRHLHSLAGSAAMVSAEILTERARELESLAEEGRLESVGAQLDELQQTLDEFIEHWNLAAATG